MGVTSVLLHSLENQWSNTIVSDDSEDDDMLPTEEYWAIPDEEWTLVEPHAKSRGVRFGQNTSYRALDDRVIKNGTCYDALDDIVDNTVLLNYQKNVLRKTSTLVAVSSDAKTVSVHVKPAVHKQPDRVIVSPMVDVKPTVCVQPDRFIGSPIVNTGGRKDCIRRMGKTPRDRDNDSDNVTKQVVEVLPVNRVVVQNNTAEEVIIIGCPVRQVVRNETTKPTVSSELVNLPQKWITRGFLELAEEARLVDVRSTPSSCMKENVQQGSEIREPMSRDVSWSIEEVVDRLVNSFSDVAIRMPTVRIDEGQLMQWPSEKSTGMMICEYTLESRIFSHGAVWREAEPVCVAAESEVFTPVFTGEFVVQADPLVVAEAVTPRVSALPTVGSEFQAGLSTSVGRGDRCSLGLENILDKVGHVAGQLKVRTVPVEDLLLFSAVYFVMPFLLRSLTVQTSTFFLSDERDEVSMPLSMREDRSRPGGYMSRRWICVPR